MNAYWNKVLHTTLSQRGLMNYKAEIIHEYTGGRTSRSRDLHDAEVKELVGRISSMNESEVRPHDPNAKGTDKYAGDPTDKQRKKVLALCHKLGWELDVPAKEGKSPPVDMGRLQNFLDTRGAVKKTLNTMDKDELNDTINQLEVLLKKSK